MLFFFKQKTAYEMRISVLSSDVCSSDLRMLKSFSIRLAGQPIRIKRNFLLVPGCSRTHLLECRDFLVNIETIKLLLSTLWNKPRTLTGWCIGPEFFRTGHPRASWSEDRKSVV